MLVILGLFNIRGNYKLSCNRDRIWPLKLSPSWGTRLLETKVHPHLQEVIGESEVSAANQVIEVQSWFLAALRVWGFPVGVCSAWSLIFGRAEWEKWNFSFGWNTFQLSMRIFPPPIFPKNICSKQCTPWAILHNAFFSFSLFRFAFQSAQLVKEGFSPSVFHCVSFFGGCTSSFFAFFTGIIGAPFLFFSPTPTVFFSFFRACPWL